ncbi:MAG: cysteine-rich CWC family protein [Janthinobacterium lividum]
MIDPDPARCPLCGEQNRCAMEIARETATAPEGCWCVSVDFASELIAKVPARARDAACICARCAARAPTL